MGEGSSTSGISHARTDRNALPVVDPRPAADRGRGDDAWLFPAVDRYRRGRAGRAAVADSRHGPAGAGGVVRVAGAGCLLRLRALAAAADRAARARRRAPEPSCRADDRPALRADRVHLNGRGKVRVGDGQWLVSGPDLPLGSTVEVVAVDGTTLKVRAAA